MRLAKNLSLVLSAAVGIGLVVPGSKPDVQLPKSTPVRTMASNSVNLDLASVLKGGATPESSAGYINLIIGADTNAANNPFIQPTDPALSGGGRDQTQQFMDLLVGYPSEYNVLIGRLGVDILVGGQTSDIIIGGPEHFNPNNRDKAFGAFGDDTFLWSPGDGSDRFDGGPGFDTVVFGLMGEVDANGQLVFQVSNNQLAGNVFIDPQSGLPRMDVTNSPGFCDVIDSSTSATAGAELAAIDAERLVRFFIRSAAQSFAAGTQTTDNGLRVTLTLKSVEYLVCTHPNGGSINVYDLRQQPPVIIPFSELPAPVQAVVQ